MLTGCLLCALGAGAASAATFYVTKTGNDASSCAAPSTPCLTIKGAVSRSEKTTEPATIEIGPGTYEEALELTRPADGGLNPASPAVNSVPASAISLPGGVSPSETDLAGNPRTIKLGSSGICSAVQDRGALQVPGQGDNCPPAAPAVKPPLAGTISALTLSPSAFYAAPSGATISKAKRKYGTLITYSDSQAATSTFTVLRANSGRRQGKSCRRPSAASRRGKRCTILTTLGTFTHADTAGVDRLHFSGRLKGRRLAAGRYTLNVAARNAAGGGPAVSRAFTIR